MGRPVHCYVYDLTQGMAKTLSRAILGQDIEGVWHASLVVGGVEYFYGYGIQQGVAGRTPFGRPVKVVDLGETEVPDAMIQDLLNDLTPRYRPQDYSFLWHNCTHFCDELSLLLTGNQVPEYLTGQGTLVLEHPFLRTMLPLFQEMEMVTGSATADGFGGANSAAQAFAPPSTSFSAAQDAANPASSTGGRSHSTQAASAPPAEAKPAGATAGKASSSSSTAHADGSGVPTTTPAAMVGDSTTNGAAALHSDVVPLPAQPVVPAMSAAGTAAAARAAVAAASAGSTAGQASDSSMQREDAKGHGALTDMQAPAEQRTHTRNAACTLAGLSITEDGDAAV